MQHLCVSKNRQAQKMVFIGSIELIIAYAELLIWKVITPRLNE